MMRPRQEPKLQPAHRFLQFFTSAFDMFVAHDQKSSLSSRFKSGFFALFFVHRRIPALNEKGRIIQKLYWNVGIVPEGTNSLASAEPKYLNRHCDEAFIHINRL